MNQEFLSDELEILSENMEDRNLAVDMLTANTDRTRSEAEALYSLAKGASKYTVEGIYDHMSFDNGYF